MRLDSVATSLRPMNVYSVYNQPPESHTETADTGSLKALETASQRPDEHVVVGDFDLHHPLWCGPSYPEQHQLSQNLLKIMQNAGLSLAFPKGTITRDTHGQRTTIDLSLVSEGLAGSMLRCGVDEELENSSDHLPIGTSLYLQACEEAAPRRRRFWKRLDEEKFKNSMRDQRLESLVVKTRRWIAIDEYINRMLQTIQTAVEDSTPWANPSMMAKAYWSSECSAAVQTARRSRKLYTSDPESKKK